MTDFRVSSVRKKKKKDGQNNNKNKKLHIYFRKYIRQTSKIINFGYDSLRPRPILG